ncbi:MAG: iron-containing alcohol dehydrogenase [Bacilli bacterium]|nr:iron-containing alcohol dehydrogenase [Bacilli bacterium]
MKNFDFHVPTKILFGKNAILQLKDEMKNHHNILLVYGGGSIKKSGLYDEVYKLLNDKNIIELSGVEPNPRVTSVNEGARLCKKYNVDAILAVGGGSVLDCSKVIAGASKLDCDAWDIVKRKVAVKECLPIYTILTLSATGSEMNGGAVISNLNTKEKIGVGSELFIPTCSVLDPTYTMSVSKYQTAAGTCDIFSHIIEVYFDNRLDAFVSDKIAEGLLKTVIKYGEIAYHEPNNYEARANLMWTSSLAINSLIECGKENNAWSCHPMEHSLSAYYDITHGVGLAILTPRWMEYILDESTIDRFVAYGRNVFDINDDDKWVVAKKAIEETKNFFYKRLNVASSLKEVNIDETYFLEMATKACNKDGVINGFKKLTIQDVVNIYKNCLE